MAAQLTPAQLAAEWQCSASYVRRLCRTGALRAMRLGSDWRISREAISEYEQRHTAQAATDATPDVALRQRTPLLLTALPDLPADYSPVFGDLWPDHAVRPAARRGGSVNKKTAGSQRH